MGARLVSLVLARWTHLSDRAFRVVVKMAHTSLDEATDKVPAATYFGGRGQLVEVLRNERGGDRETGYRTVKRAIAELLADAAIERVSAGRAGKNATYRLTLLNTPKSIGERHCTVEIQGDTSGPEWGTPGVPPRNHEEQGEDGSKEIRLPVLPVVSAVDTTGGTLPPDPLRPDDPPGHRLSSESSTSDGGDQPPQPETATHDGARDSEADPVSPPVLRLIEGNSEAPSAAQTAPSRPRWVGRGADAIAEATARRQAAIAAHRAREASGE